MQINPESVDESSFVKNIGRLSDRLYGNVLFGGGIAGDILKLLAYSAYSKGDTLELVIGQEIPHDFELKYMFMPVLGYLYNRFNSRKNSRLILPVSEIYVCRKTYCDVGENFSYKPEGVHSIKELKNLVFHGDAVRFVELDVIIENKKDVCLTLWIPNATE